MVLLFDFGLFGSSALPSVDFCWTLRLCSHAIHLHARFCSGHAPPGPACGISPALSHPGRAAPAGRPQGGRNLTSCLPGGLASKLELKESSVSDPAAGHDVPSPLMKTTYRGYKDWRGNRAVRPGFLCRHRELAKANSHLC